ncbi:MAG: gamma carbonic anhydrase family protein [Verrucomicrobiae bacterium]|nr:gamma carbonic anhydrase family protein [Verrucomicrobiae bacterium]
MSHLFAAPGGKSPRVAADVYVAAGARLVGDVEVGAGSSVWFNAVLRGDLAPVRVGCGTNLQELSVCHVADDHPCVVGNYVTVGHAAILHGCIIGDEVLVGMGAIVMTGARVGPRCIIGAGALVTEGVEVPEGSLVYGSPARVVSRLDQAEQRKIRELAEKYARLAAGYRAGCVAR